MRCVIGNANLKIWGRAIHTIISAGEDDVHFQFSNTAATVTSFDSSFAVCCTCSFESEFFDRYEITAENQLACRVPSKCFLKAFRSLRFLTKSVVSCVLDFDKEGDFMEISLQTKTGPVISYKVGKSIELDAIEIDCHPEKLCNWIKVDPKFILGTVSNFGPTNKVADLTLKTLQDKILLKNCTTDVVKREGKIYTELSVNSVEFAEYSIRQDSEITVPLREFKSFVSLAEGLKLDLSIHFQSATDPVIIVVQNEYYKASLTMATRVLTGDNTSQQISPANSGLISNVSSQHSSHPPHDRPAAAPETSFMRNVELPNEESDSEEGILAQVNEVNKLMSSTSVSNKSSSRVTEPTGASRRTSNSKNRSLSSVQNTPLSNIVEPNRETTKSQFYKKKSEALAVNNSMADTSSSRVLRQVESHPEAGPSDFDNNNEIESESAHSLKSLHDKTHVSESFSQSLLDEVNEMEDQVCTRALPFDRHDSHSQPPKKKFRTIESMFPDLGRREPYIIPGMDVILLPASDEEDN